MGILFSDAKVLIEKELDGPVPQKVLELMAEKGIGPSIACNARGVSYDFGILELIQKDAEAAFEARDYQRIPGALFQNDPRFTVMEQAFYLPPGFSFSPMQSNSQAQSEMLQENLAGISICGAYVIMNQAIGIVSTYIHADDKSLIERVRFCYSHYSMSFVEKDLPVLKR